MRARRPAATHATYDRCECMQCRASCAPACPAPPVLRVGALSSVAMQEEWYFRSSIAGAGDEVVVRFMQPRLGIFFGDTRLGDVVVSTVDRSSEASGCLMPGMVLTHVAGSRLPRGAPAVTIHALLKQKTARPLTLAFSPHQRAADRSLEFQTQARHLAPSNSKTSTLPNVARSTSKASGTGRPPVWLLCGQPGRRRNGGAPDARRPAGVSRDKWQ